MHILLTRQLQDSKDLIQKFKSHGFNKFVLCLKYKSNLIKKHLNRKEKLGIKLKYKNENN